MRYDGANPVLLQALIVIGQTIQKRRGQAPIDTEDTLSDFDLILSLLPSTKANSAEDEEEETDSETDDILREATLLLLRLTYAQAHSQIESQNQEMELLRNAPAQPPSRADQDSRGKQRDADGDMWKLDAPVARGGPDGKGPLLDPTGKVRGRIAFPILQGALLTKSQTASATIYYTSI